GAGGRRARPARPGARAAGGRRGIRGQQRPAALRRGDGALAHPRGAQALLPRGLPAGAGDAAAVPRRGPGAGRRHRAVRVRQAQQPGDRPRPGRHRAGVAGGSRPPAGADGVQLDGRGADPGRQSAVPLHPVRAGRALVDLSPLRVGTYRRVWASGLLAVLGIQVATVAVLFQVWALTRNPFWVGAIGLVQAVPLILFGLVGGPLADVLDRRRVALWSTGGQSLAGLA